VRALSTPKEDYSDYQGHLSDILAYSALITGFILTVFTLLLTLLPNSFLASLEGQIALIFVAILFYLFLILGLLIRTWGFRWVKRIPPRSWQTRFLRGFFFLAILFFGFLIPLLFLIWGFFLLAIIMGTVWLVIFAFYLLFEKVTIGSLKREPE
jgi:hypothetical protein